MISVNFVTIVLLVLIFSFFALFELERPKACDLVLVAELCAVCVCARAVFSFVPYFNPVVAFVMLFSVPLGAKKGFMIGALTALVSNFIFGQGLWTIYQMAGWGISGALFGVFGKIRVLRRSEWKWSDYAAAIFLSVLTVLFLSGPIADLSSFVMMGGGDFAVLKMILLGGFVFNVALAASCAITFALCAKPVLFALSRLQKKTA